MGPVDQPPHEANTNPSRRVNAITVFCASSRQCDTVYHDAARRLGQVLAGNGITVVYGGGAIGSMGALADGALARGGRVIGVLPRFMQELEWGHKGLSELHLVDDMRQRKERMLEGSQGVVALPGGCGTLEELFEVITLKRLGLFVHPIILVNTRRFFDSLVQLLSLAITERFMDQRHAAMWQVVSEPEEVPGALEAAPPWSRDARRFAAL
ncbi:MAG: TIGR00730 family Rossman fold protein [Candidatus Eisenbacteria bacterium]|nr:TIGR00730 family Rossman fold protein [Candidatus Eisenbacteria bacterium]